MIACMPAMSLTFRHVVPSAKSFKSFLSYGSVTRSRHAAKEQKPHTRDNESYKLHVRKISRMSDEEQPWVHPTEFYRDVNDMQRIVPPEKALMTTVTHGSQPSVETGVIHMTHEMEQSVRGHYRV